jgi:hypothetical protein
MPRAHYSVYVVELTDEVWSVGRFRRTNGTTPCLTTTPA